MTCIQSVGLRKVIQPWYEGSQAAVISHLPWVKPHPGSEKIYPHSTAPYYPLDGPFQLYLRFNEQKSPTPYVTICLRPLGPITPQILETPPWISVWDTNVLQRGSDANSNIKPTCPLVHVQLGVSSQTMHRQRTSLSVLEWWLWCPNTFLVIQAFYKTDPSCLSQVRPLFHASLIPCKSHNYGTHHTFL